MRYLSVLTVGLTAALGCSSALGQSVERFGVFELSLTSITTYTNPYVDVSVTATFVGPSDTKTIPAFWDGGKTWRVRFSPDAVGSWSYSTSSSDSKLKKSGTFSCVASQRHGAIESMPQTPLHFQHEDGAPFWWFGETNWYLFRTNAAENLTYQTAIEYIDVRASQGFNYLTANLLAGTNDGGSAFTGGVGVKVNPDYWQDVDLRVQYLAEKGIIAGLVLAWKSDGQVMSWNWNHFASQDTRLRYCRYIAARYSAYPVVWTLAGEYNENPTSKPNSVLDWTALANEVRNNDPHDRMMAIHSTGSVEDLADQSWMDFGDYMQYSGELHTPMLAAMDHAKPVVNAEYSYFLQDMDENGVPDSHEGNTIEEFRHASWDIAMSGGYFVAGFGTTYMGGTRDPGPFDVHAAKNDPAEEQLSHIPAFFHAVNWWMFTPDDSRITGGGVRYCLKDDADNYLAYVRGTTASVQLQLINSTQQTYTIRRYDPRTGAWSDLPSQNSNGTITLTTPDSRDWAFIVSKGVGSLRMTSPNGGEGWEVGSTHDILWDPGAETNPVSLEFSTDNGQSWQSLVTGTSNDGAFSWQVPNLNSSNCLLRVADADDGNPVDQSDAVFAISQASASTITLLSPNGGEQWIAGSQQIIGWQTSGSLADVRLEYSLDAGSSWTVIAVVAANANNQAWTLPKQTSTQCLVRLIDNADGDPFDVSNTVFAITPVGAPGQQLPNMQPWVGDIPGSLFDAEIVVDEGETRLRFTGTTANVGNGALDVRGVVDATGTLPGYQRIHFDNGSYQDIFVGYFVFNGHENHDHFHFQDFNIYRLYEVNSDGSKGALVKPSDKISFCLTDSDPYDLTLPGAPANSVFSCEQQGISVGWSDRYGRNTEGQWIVIDDVEDGEYWLEIEANPAGLLFETDLADNRRSIRIAFNKAAKTVDVLSGAINITAPNGGEAFNAGASTSITWNSSGAVGNVKIEFSSNDGASWSSVVSSTSNDGTHPWTIPAASSSQCRVRISVASTGDAVDVSDALFAIIGAPSAPSIVSFSPSSGPVGTEVTINGSHFIGTTAVKFNEIAASVFNFDSDAQLRAIAPSGATSGKISITTTNGAASSANDFTVTTSGGSTTVSVEPTDDAYVKLTSPTSNYGSATTLRVRKTGSETLYSFLKFTISGLTDVVQSGKLRLYVSDASPEGGSLFAVSNNYKDTSTPWTQSGLNWNNAPLITGTALSSMGAVSAGTWIEFDVTSAIASNGTYSFALKSNTSDPVFYGSRESSNKPSLMIETGTGTPPAAPIISAFHPTSGAIGAEVTITGSNLGGATNVTFDGAAATFAIDNATQIRATVPGSAASGKIIVATPAGSAQSADDFTVTGGASTTLSFTPFQDAYVRSSTPTTTYGSVSALRLRKSGSESLNSYLKFEVSGLTGAMQSVTLRLYVTDAGSDGGSVYAVSNNYLGTNTSWVQSGLNWSNAPEISGTALASVGAVTVGSWVEVDVTAAITGNGIFSFGLKNNSSNAVYYSSQEGSNKPVLIVQVNSLSMPNAEHVVEDAALPKKFVLHQNFPNPFNGQTTIEYSLPEAARVRITIYNALGQLVRHLVDQNEAAGIQRAIWDGKDNNRRGVGAGVYFCELRAGGRRFVGRMILQL